MQLDGNTFYGDVVLDSVYMVSREEGIIWDEIYKKQIFSVLYYIHHNKNQNIFAFINFI